MGGGMVVGSKMADVFSQKDVRLSGISGYSACQPCYHLSQNFKFCHWQNDTENKQNFANLIFNNSKPFFCFFFKKIFFSKEHLFSTELTTGGRLIRLQQL